MRQSFQVLLQTEQGQPITTMQKLCSKDANGWVQFSFDIMPQLTPYLGKPVQISFNANFFSDPRANFFIYLDDILLYVTHN